MSKIAWNEVDELNATLSVTIERSDYEDAFKQELKKYRKQGQMKGFRKGKTPVSVIRKMYGKAILAEIVNEKLQDQLSNYLREEGHSFILQPLPSEDQDQMEIDATSLEDYEFEFDLALEPDFEIKGLEDTYTRYVVEVTPEMIDDEIARLRKRYGETVHPEEDIQENDIVRFAAKELEDGAIKEGGVENEFSILVDRLQDGPKAKVLASKLGDTLTLDLFELEKDASEASVRSYLLELDEEDEQEVNQEFECTILEVSRIEEPEFGPALFDKLFGENVVSGVDEAREKIAEGIQDQYEGQTQALLIRAIQDALAEQNQPAVSESFIKRWVLTSDESMTPEKVEEQMEDIMKSVHWSIVTGRLREKYGVDVTFEEIRAYFAQQLMGYFGGQMMPGMEQMIDSTVERMVSDQDQVNRTYQELQSRKLFDAIVEEVDITNQTVAKEELEEIIAETNAKLQPPAAEEEE